MGNERQELRTNLCHRFGGRCAYCNIYVGMAGTVDHYLPQALGGNDAPHNLRWACLRCNGLKADTHPSEWEIVRRTLPRPRETPAQARARLHMLIAQRALNYRG